MIGASLAIGAVRPAIAWGGPGQEEPLMTPGVSTLFGGLVLELFVAVRGRAGFAVCSGCGLPYVPDRRPRAGAFGNPRANYCPTCRSKHATQNAAAKRWRDKHPGYSRDHRARARQAGLAPEGAPRQSR